MRRVVLPVYALIFLEQVAWVAIVPLAPSFSEQLSLSKVETGTLLASASLATLVISFPIGLAADRVGARALTIGSAALLSLSSLGQGLAGDFWSLLTARAAFGLALGTVWTAGLAWISDSLPSYRSTEALGATVAVSGLGIMVGPAFAGLLADNFGLGAPFLVIAGGGAALTAALLLGDPGKRLERSPQPLAEALHAARREPFVLASLALMLLLGLVNGGINLLAPLQLRANGVSAGTIGLAFSAASGVFTAVSALVARLGGRAVNLRTVGVGALLFGFSLLVAVASATSAAVVGFLLLRSPFWAVLSTIVYPLGAVGAARAGLGRGALIGLLNLVWGLASALGPLAAGGLAQVAGERWTYVTLVAGCVATALWTLRLGEPLASLRARGRTEPR